MARLARVLLLAVSAAALAASASSRSQSPPPAVGAWNAQPPQAQAMDPRVSYGLWKTTFGAVKIEEESPGRIHGVWTYDRQGQQVVGYFAGALDGNVLRLTWREPAQPDASSPQLTGEGWLVFDPGGGRFTGRWWTNSHDRQGDWTGERGMPAAAAQPGYAVGGAYGGTAYGGDGYGGYGYGAPTYPPPPPPPGSY
ncbi:MAG TPA: hypothetical protein VM734_09125 [Kofleriaceae bacterium]|nr:hypothetical protein [Kofleriaceae bacterium]